jgi:hypothetical protein
VERTDVGTGIDAAVVQPGVHRFNASRAEVRGMCSMRYSAPNPPILPARAVIDTGMGRWPSDRPGGVGASKGILRKGIAGPGPGPGGCRVALSGWHLVAASGIPTALK